MPPKRKQNRSNTKKITKHQCKQTKKRTGETWDEIIDTSLVPKRESKIKKMAKLALQLGTIGAGIYGTTYPNKIIDWRDKINEKNKEDNEVDDNNRSLDQIIYKLKKNPESLNYSEVIKTLNDIRDEIATVRSPYIHKPNNPIDPDIGFTTEDGWNETIKKLAKYYKTKLPSLRDALTSRDNMIGYIENLRNEYNEANNNGALTPEYFNKNVISSIQSWAKHLQSAEPSTVDYQNINHWLPKTKNMIWSVKPGRHVSDLEGNVAEYLKSEDTLKNIIENAKNQNSEADKQKLKEIGNYMGDLVKTYKEAFNL